MASQETPNYRLSRWAGTDRILVEEFNDNWDKIDTALKSNADKAAALQTALASCGNCKIEVKTYTGTGTYGSSSPNTLTFSAAPLLVLLGGGQGLIMGLLPGCTVAKTSFEEIGYTCSVDWNGSSVTWYTPDGTGTAQFNVKNNIYYAIAFFSA